MADGWINEQEERALLAWFQELGDVDLIQYTLGRLSTLDDDQPRSEVRRDIAVESAIDAAGEMAGGWIGGKAFKGAQWLINKAKGSDDSSLSAERILYPETRSSGGIADMLEFVEVSPHAELLAWVKSRIKTLTKGLLNPDVSALRAKWRSAS